MEAHLKRTLELLSLCLFIACETGPSVEVTGAVQNPGRFDIQSHDVDAIASEADLLPEGDMTRAYIIRPVGEDSLGRLITAHVPIHALDSLKAGDNLHIPFRTYPVTIDSVSAIRDLDITHEDRRYRLSRGTLVHGLVEGEDQVVIILGHGLIEEQGQKARSAGFHYLYARMHPDQYAVFSPFITMDTTEPDAVEDARVINVKLLDNAEYSEVDRVIRPPAEYLKIFAGALPQPRSESHPGPGMRRRTYDDGRIWTTFNDGSQRTRYPSGRVIRRTIGGSLRTEKTNGDVEIKDPAGNVRTEYADGRVETQRASGTHILELPNGYRKTRYHNGMSVERAQDGTKTTRYSTGAVTTVHPDGRRVNTFKSGLSETTLPNGRIQIITEVGDTILRKSDGTEIVRTTGGEEVITFADGRRMQSSRYEPLIDLGPDGGKRTTAITGEKITVMPDGERRITYHNGTRRTIFPDGRDVVDEVGISTLHRKDGSRVRTYRANAGGERPAMKSLLEVTDIPEAVELGEQIGIGVTPAPSVLDVRVTLLPQPRGHVIDLPITFIDSTYGTAHHRFSEETTYRLQVLGKVGEKIWQIGFDRLIKVGDGSPDSLVVPLRANGSPSAIKRRLFERINEDRLALKLRPLQPDHAVDEVILERLWDLLDALDKSTPKFLTEPTEERMRHRGLWFEDVREYTATTPDPVDAHIRLMLQDTRYRSSIQDATWTHLGVAVEPSGDAHLFGILLRK